VVGVTVVAHMPGYDFGMHPAFRSALYVVVLFVVASAWSTGAQDAFVVSGDGILACPGSQVVRDAGISMSGDSEGHVVAEALTQWTDQGGVVVTPPTGETW